MSETKKRSMTKSISYRTGCIIIIFAVIYLITENIKMASLITVVHQSVMTIFYYFHERIWNRVEWERKFSDKEDPNNSEILKFKKSSKIIM